jgi:multicomponent Na+:H+ antiporter subunit F
MVQAVRGATTFDRVVSIDGLTAMGVAVLALFAIQFEESIFMDIALVYAFIAFVADLAVAKSLEGKGLDE